MNVKALKQTCVTPTPNVTTPKDPISVAVWKVMKAMDAIAQVTLSSERHFSSLVSDIHCNLFFQLCRLPVLHLVAQTRSVEKVMEVRSVSVVLVTKVTGTFVQVGMRNTVLWRIRVRSFANFHFQVVNGKWESWFSLLEITRHAHPCCQSKQTKYVLFTDITVYLVSPRHLSRASNHIPWFFSSACLFLVAVKPMSSLLTRTSFV